MKFLCHVAPRSGAEEDCAQWTASFGHALRAQTAGEALTVECLARLANDAFGKRTPYRATLELQGEAATPERLAELLAGLGEHLSEVAHPERSTSLMGEDVVFVKPPSSATVRYQYLMRKKAAYTHAAYLERYREIHSQFGLRTPGTLGYVQFHVDPATSERVARATGLGVFDIDSVSELHLASQEIFLAAVSASPVGPEAIADEELFVDRFRSVDFCSRLLRS